MITKTKDLPWDDREHLYVTIRKLQKEGRLLSVFKELGISSRVKNPQGKLDYDFLSFWLVKEVHTIPLYLIAMAFDKFLSFDEQDALIIKGGIK